MKGLTKELILEISERHNDPKWMKELRLQGLKLWKEMPMSKWGPKVFAETEEEKQSGEWLDIDKMEMYVRPKTEMVAEWKDVPKEIRETFEALGIPEAERERLGGLGAQYDSEMAYFRLKEEVAAQGVICLPMDEAVRDKRFSKMIRGKFMKLVPASDNKFTALHAAVHSGGVFIYVPEGISAILPLQAYYRFNEAGAGQFEHSMVILEEGAELHFIEGCSAPKYSVANLHVGCVEMYVGKNAHLRFSAMVNWSKNLFNLTTKRAQLEEGATMEWISGVFGSKVSMLYPMTILNGRGAKLEYTGVSFAGEGQVLDTGAKVVHVAPETCSTILTKSVAKNGGVSGTRTLARILPGATGAVSRTDCKSLILDSHGSRAEAVPEVKVECEESQVAHEASVGKVSDEVVRYLQSRGITEEDARALIVQGFISGVSKELPFEYAREMNDLINLEMRGM